MIIGVYKTLLQENKIPMLVKENEFSLSGKKFCSPEVVFDLMKAKFQITMNTEEFVYELCFDTKLNLIGVFEISHGTINSSITSSREVYQKALMIGAAGIILVHNHPSGDTEPSMQDIDTAKMVYEAGKILGISLVDFIIVGDNYYSFRKENIF